MISLGDIAPQAVFAVRYANGGWEQIVPGSLELMQDWFGPATFRYVQSRAAIDGSQHASGSYTYACVDELTAYRTPIPLPSADS